MSRMTISLQIAAQQPNPNGLGLFGRLPSEIRHDIWLETIRYCYLNEPYPDSEPFRYLGGQGWQHLYHVGGYKKDDCAFCCPLCHWRETFNKNQFCVFTPTSYDLPDSSIWIVKPMARYLAKLNTCLLSKYIKREYEDVFLSNHNFAFEAANSLNVFLDLLPECYNLPYISMIPWNMTHGCPLVCMEEAWPKAFARLPGRGIKEICFRLGTHRNDKRPRRLFDGPLTESSHMTKRTLYEIRLMREHIIKYLPEIRFSVGGPCYQNMSQHVRQAYDFDAALVGSIVSEWQINWERITHEHLMQIVL